MLNNKLVLFVVIPVCLNLLVLGLYYSGYQFAQYLISPQIEWLHHRSWREFGMLEQLQNIYLLTIVILFGVAVVNRQLLLERVFFLCGALVMLFLLLEEIDYGIHFYEYYIGHESDIQVKSRNWHNNEISGESITGHLKQVTGFAMILWFLIFPLISGRVKFATLERIIPSRWFVVGFGLSLLFSSLAHYLDDHGLDIINGVAGSLKGNVSEFRETNTYYLYMLYAMQLFATADLFSLSSGKHQRNA